MAAVAVGLDAVVGEALACPVCDTATGVAVREAIFERRISFQRVQRVAPVSIILGIVAALHVRWSSWRLVSAAGTAL